jgi:hypothetical protein
MKRIVLLSWILVVAAVYAASAAVPGPEVAEPAVCLQAEPEVAQPRWQSGICGDCPGNCADLCAALRQDCLVNGGSPSQCETKYQNCLSWCNN